MIPAVKNRQHPLFFLILFLPFFIVAQSEAETRYVSDQLTINIKDNLEKPYQVIAKVRSNDAVTVLEENDTYARIETADKQVGWIGKQYLTTTLPKTLVIAQLQKEIEALKTQPQGAVTQKTSDAAIPPTELEKERDRLQLELETAKNRIKELQDSMVGVKEQPTSPSSAVTTQEIKGLEEKKTQLESEITALQAQVESLNDGTVDIPALIQEKEHLLQEIKDKDTKIATLSTENAKLAKTATIYWFCAGALVFLTGMFSGKMFGRKKAKYSY
jgi:SH3 domain protein